MTSKAEHIKGLALDEVAGTLSAEDRDHLYEAISNDEASFEVWKEVQECFATSAAQVAIERLPTTLPLERVMEKVTAGKSERVYWLMGVGMAASLLGLVVFYWLGQPSKGTGETQYAQHSIKSGVELQLSNGSKVNLSQQQGQLQMAGLALSNTQKSLTYASTSNTNGTVSASLNIPPGKDYKITLSDGTEVWLNAATLLDFPLQFTGNTREVRVNGEAYFKVAHNAKKPFLVHLPHSIVRVLGTEFNVNTYDSGKINVSLVEGKVAMKAEHDSAILKPGYEIAYQYKKGMQVRSFDSEILSWRHGIFTFQDAELKEVLKVVSRWYGVNVVLDNPNHASKRFFGVIDRNQPVQELLERIKAINKIDYQIDKDGVIHIK